MSAVIKSWAVVLWMLHILWTLHKQWIANHSLQPDSAFPLSLFLSPFSFPLLLLLFCLRLLVPLPIVAQSFSFSLSPSLSVALELWPVSEEKRALLWFDIHLFGMAESLGLQLSGRLCSSVNCCKCIAGALCFRKLCVWYGHRQTPACVRHLCWMLA